MLFFSFNFFLNFFFYLLPFLFFPFPPHDSRQFLVAQIVYLLRKKVPRVKDIDGQKKEFVRQEHVICILARVSNSF